jgi:gluconokinase
VLALDIGSSSVRAAIHDHRGRTVRGTEVRAGYAWDVASDSVRLDSRVLLDLTGEVLDQVASAAGPLAPEVVAGGVSCFFHSLVGLDAAGRPLTPVLSWADMTSADDAIRLRERLDPAMAHQVSGVPIHASYWPSRIVHLRREEPQIRRWAGFPELLTQALVGRQLVSRSMASGTGLLDRAAGDWSPLLLDLLGIEPAALPSIVPDDESIGRLTRAAADRWPSLAHLSWFAPWGDGSCGNVGLGATAPDRAALMVGTSGALRAVIADPAPPIPEGLFAYRLGGGTVAGGQLSEGGGLLAWTSRLLGRSRAALERAAAAIPADGHGLTVLPYALGERGLGYHDRARGTLTGLQPGTDPAAVYRATMESIAFGFAAIDDRLAQVLGGAPSVVASGGALARSPLFVQVLADALGREIGVAPRVEASGRGAAILALRGLGLIADVGSVAGPRARRVRPASDRVDRYRAARARQDVLYASLLDGAPAGNRQPN